MSFLETKLTLSDGTRDVQSLDFVKLGTVGKTDAKGATTITMGEYTFIVTADTLRYRHKPAGRATASSAKPIKSFAQLDKFTADKLPQQTEPPVVATTVEAVETPAPTAEAVETQAEETKQIAENAEEETHMTKFVIENKEFPVEGKMLAVVKKFKLDGKEVLGLEDLDTLIDKANAPADKVVVEAFEKQVSDALQAGAVATPATEQNTQTPAGGTQQEAPAGEQEEGTPKVEESNIFDTDEEDPGEKPKDPKDEAEAQRKREERKAKQAENELKMQEGRTLIEEIRQDVEGIDGSTAAVKALAKLLVVEEKLPLLATLVSSDTRLRPEIKNTVKAADRVYHPSLRNNPLHTQTGANIAPKYALASYKLNMRESNPSQPVGFFLMVPPSMINLTPTKLSLHSEREKVISAAEAEDTTSDRVVKLFSKAEALSLVSILGVPMSLWDPRTKTLEAISPEIYLHSKPSEVTGVPVYSLRARNAEGGNTKLSIRKFLPLATHNTTKISSTDFDPKLTSDALFKRMLFTVPQGAPDNKFNQLQEEYTKRFKKLPDGDYVYTAFQDKETVLAYDATEKNPQMVQMELPLVKLSKPTTSGASARPVFVKTKHNDPGTGYNKKFVQLRELVGDQINKLRKETQASVLNSYNAEIARLTAIKSLMSGTPLKIK